MDIYKEKFTSLEREILRVLFAHTGKELNQRRIALNLHVSPTAVSKCLKNLEKNKLIIIKKQEYLIKSIVLNLENKDLINLKRVENLRAIYFSGLIDYLSSEFKLETIVSFGSYSRGEDHFDSDIDIAIIGADEKDLDISKYEKLFGKKIIIQFYKSFNEVHKNLKESLLNGIVLQGGIGL